MVEMLHEVGSLPRWLRLGRVLLSHCPCQPGLQGQETTGGRPAYQQAHFSQLWSWRSETRVPGGLQGPVGMHVCTRGPYTSKHEARCSQ